MLLQSPVKTRDSLQLVELSEILNQSLSPKIFIHVQNPGYPNDAKSLSTITFYGVFHLIKFCILNRIHELLKYIAYLLKWKEDVSTHIFYI